MDKKPSFKCFFGLHSMNIIQKEDLNNLWGNKVGIVFITECECCGKVKYYKIYTIDQTM